jgi:NAD-dependent dihydropyrimidine dehydrogenase PreA subunit
MVDNCDAAAGKLVPVVDHSKCEGKAECVRVCPYDVFEVRTIEDDDFAPLPVLAKLKVWAHGKKTAYTPNASECHACGLCVIACPERAVKLVRPS